MVGATASDCQGEKNAQLKAEGVKAILGIARRKGVDLEALLYDRCQVQRPDDLVVRQASLLIDELRSMGDAGES